MIYDYPPKIQERIKKLDEYKDKLPKDNKNKIFIKSIFSILCLFVFSLVLKYINKYDNFIDSFKYGYLLWSIVNLYDLIVLDIIWFCHDKHFILKGSEDMKEEYHNYLFHIKGFFTGEILGLVVCLLVSLIIKFIL